MYPLKNTSSDGQHENFLASGNLPFFQKCLKIMGVPAFQEKTHPRVAWICLR